MDSIMDKIAEKISAQDLIRANSQAETAEAARIKQEAEQYRRQLEEIRNNDKDYRQQLDEYMKQNRDYSEDFEDIKDKISQNDQKIHDIGVQTYRNVQAVVEKSGNKTMEELKEIERRVETVTAISENKNGGLMPVVIITLIISAADLIINVLRLLGII
ncbi:MULTISPECIES: hypothetical protein [unclassified Butyrivibrio]|uniref:hypothetical protein n=1 Tax=unclassified Butyrivibrio TaxID=2639466 RepID=UPI0008E794B4|nr:MULTISPECIES: hypothetical protein [unclassified Butyrivibrio]RKM59478.1 hypothetical protein D6856_09675 [Butyrivibrio sp. XB500-5]SFU87752.1 hypothetical protein SAMN02910342_02170 [Butyrivibrio sp. INlla21]